MTDTFNENNAAIEVGVGGDEQDDEDKNIHDIDHLSEHIKNSIATAGLSGSILVDELLKGFLAKKMEDIEIEHQKQQDSIKKEDDDKVCTKSRKHKHKKKHKSKSKHKKSDSKSDSNDDKNQKSRHRHHTKSSHQSNNDDDRKSKSKSVKKNEVDLDQNVKLDLESVLSKNLCDHDNEQKSSPNKVAAKEDSETNCPPVLYDVKTISDANIESKDSDLDQNMEENQSTDNGLMGDDFRQQLEYATESHLCCPKVSESSDGEKSSDNHSKPEDQKVPVTSKKPGEFENEKFSEAVQGVSKLSDVMKQNGDSLVSADFSLSMDDLLHTSQDRLCLPEPRKECASYSVDHYHHSKIDGIKLVDSGKEPDDGSRGVKDYSNDFSKQEMSFYHKFSLSDAPGKSETEQQDKSRSLDHDSRSKGHSRKTEGRSDDHSRTSKSRSKGHSRKTEGRSDDHSRTSKSRSKDHGRKSKSRSKDCSRNSESRSKDISRNSESRSKDHGRKSEGRSKDHSRNSESRSKDQSRKSEDCISGSRHQDRKASDSGVSDRNEDLNRPVDFCVDPKDHGSIPKDSRVCSSERDSGLSRNRCSSDRDGEKHRSTDHRHRSKRCSSSSTEHKHNSRKRSLEKGERDEGFRSHSHKSKKQKRKRTREKSLEIIEDEEAESADASDKLTERLLKRLNTSIRKGQELKAERHALLEQEMHSGAEDGKPSALPENRENSGEALVIKEEEKTFQADGKTASLVVLAQGLPSTISGYVAGVDIPDNIPNGTQKEEKTVTVKPGLPKGKKPGIKMGIRLTESSVAIISSGVKVETEQKDGTAEPSGTGDLPPNTPKLNSRLDQIPESEGIELKATSIPVKENSSRAESDVQREKGTKLKSKKRRKSRSRSGSRENKLLKDSQFPTKLTGSEGRGRRSRSRSRDRGRRSRSQSKDRGRRVRERGRRLRSPSKDRGRKSRSQSRGRARRSRSRSRDRGRRSGSRSRDRGQRSRSRSRNRGHRSSVERHRRRSRSHSSELKKPQENAQLKIDKARLREIAIKNVYGNLRSGSGAVGDLKPDAVVSLKAGGKSVEELTDFCKRIAERERRRSADSSSPEVTPPSDDEDQPFTSNSFKARDLTGSIVLNIRNSKPLPILTSQEKIAKAAELRTQFPVSSGSQHRAKEWVQVETKKPGEGAETSAGSVNKGEVNEDKVFPDSTDEQIDIAHIVSERISALRKLQTNPNDVEALGNVFQSQQKMQQWAVSKQPPGLFVGSTGVNVLSQKDLMGINPRNQAWVKKDRLRVASEVT